MLTEWCLGGRGEGEDAGGGYWLYKVGGEIFILRLTYSY